MKTSNAYLSVLMAGLLAASVHAQTTPAAGSSDLPPKAGEVSTQTQGAPNAKTTNSPVSEAPSPSTSTSASVYSAAPVAQSASTVSTTTAMGAVAGAEAPKTRAQVKAELMSRRTIFEQERRALRGTHRTHFMAG